MGEGPSIYRGLKDIGTDDERVTVLARRLRDKGATFKGNTPTASVISKAKARTERRKMLEGLDASLILDSPVRGSSGSRRGRNKVPVSYAESGSDQEGSDEEFEDFSQ
tara:strand:+ start:88 stop:411 length:324 start_codon:yes stop_codon:yes gene_type:complete